MVDSQLKPEKFTAKGVGTACSVTGAAACVPRLRLHFAVRYWQRLAGLLLRPRLGPGQGLWIYPCRAIHTVGMRYAIDVVFLDAHGWPVTVVSRLRPYRFAICSRARSVVELPAGYCSLHPCFAAAIHQALIHHPGAHVRGLASTSEHVRYSIMEEA